MASHEFSFISFEYIRICLLSKVIKRSLCTEGGTKWGSSGHFSCSRNSFQWPSPPFAFVLPSPIGTSQLEWTKVHRWVVENAWVLRGIPRETPITLSLISRSTIVPNIKKKKMFGFVSCLWLIIKSQGQWLWWPSRGISSSLWFHSSYERTRPGVRIAEAHLQNSCPPTGSNKKKTAPTETHVVCKQPKLQ